jgi:hypothetical protein
MKKVKVKILDSIAGLADPKPTAELDKKYSDKITQMNRQRKNPFSAAFIEELVTDWKKSDRYGEQPLGFRRDWSFKPDQEAMISAELAEKWEEAGLCMILRDETKKAA